MERVVVNGTNAVKIRDEDPKSGVGFYQLVPVKLEIAIVFLRS